MQPWKLRKMRRTKSMRWIKKTVIRTNDDELAALGAARLSGDQAALGEIMREARWAAGSIAAIQYIQSPELIDAIAEIKDSVRRGVCGSLPIKEYKPRVREAAIRKSVNQPLLRELAIYDKRLYGAAVETLTDQEFLAEVAKTAEWERAGVLAFNKLADETLRRSVCGKDAKSENRFQAAAELGDYETLVEVFKNTPEIQTRQETLNRLEKAVETLANEALLVEIAKNAEWEKAGVLAFNKLTDETLRRSVCGEDAKPENRLGAAAELGDYKALMEVFKTNTDTTIRKEALSRLVKSEFPDLMEWLRNTALHDIDICVRIAAYAYLPEYSKDAVRLYNDLDSSLYTDRVSAAHQLMDIFEQDRFALTVLGRAALKRIEMPRESSESPYLDEVMWNGTYADEPGFHTDTGIGLKFREYEGFDT
jgi:uncharacterized DUF497 family protein